MTGRTFLDDLRFAEEHILAEQVRLLLKNVISSTLPVFFLSALTAYILANDNNRALLLLWWIVVNLSKYASYLVAYRALTLGIAPGTAKKVALTIMAFYIISGTTWGVLPWFTLDTATAAGRVITLSLMAGVIASAMAQTSFVLGVFIGYASPTIALTGLKLLDLHDPDYTTFALATLLYFFGLLSLARNNAAAALEAIRLRFENSELLERLRHKSAAAETSMREAELANQAKSKFLAAASHDLRQPIHAQGLFLEVLSRTPLNRQQQELVNNIRISSESSSEMLATLLDFSRIEAGVIKPLCHIFALQPLLHKLENDLAPQANAKGLIYRSRDTELQVHSDPKLVELIVRNFISNAIRYTSRGGVLVGCRKHGAEAVLEVWDTGIGIEPSQQQEIFHEFHQLGNPERDSRKGLGLGLAIAEGLAETLGHHLSLASIPRRGSVFRLTLPLAATAVAQTPQETIEQGDELQGIRLLVIDDDETVRKGMRHLLQDWGGICEIAEGIEEALALAHQHPPDVVISDYRLREQRTGTEAITALRELLGQDLPALLITGDIAPERIREAEASSVPLLHKPLAPAQLHTALLHLLTPRKESRS